MSHFISFCSGHLKATILLHLFHHQLTAHYLQLWFMYLCLIAKHTPPIYMSIILSLIQHSRVFIPYTQLLKVIGFFIYFLLYFRLCKKKFPSAFQCFGLHLEPLTQSSHHFLLTQTAPDSYKDCSSQYVNHPCHPIHHLHTPHTYKAQYYLFLPMFRKQFMMSMIIP